MSHDVKRYAAVCAPMYILPFTGAGHSGEEKVLRSPLTVLWDMLI